MTGFRMQSIWAYIAVDPITDDEGLISIPSPQGQLPLIASDKVRLDQIRPVAERIAAMGEYKVKLIRFSNREEVLDGE